MQGSQFDAQPLMQSDLPTESLMPLNIAERKVRNVLFKDLCEVCDAFVVCLARLEEASFRQCADGAIPEECHGTGDEGGPLA